MPDPVRALADEVGVERVVRNPFRSIIVRSLEVFLAVEEAERLVDEYVEPTVAAVPVPPRAGVGWGASEAPRGMLVHRYETDQEGTILDARIVPPTAQNQPAIEDDLRSVVLQHLADHPDADTSDADDDELRHRCEMAVRNHDPCISCSTHFLQLEVDRPGRSSTDPGA